MTARRPFTEADRERTLAKRDEWVQRIPRRYSPVAHLAVSIVAAAGCIALAVVTVDRFGPAELLFCVGVLVFANAAEWRVHRDVLHKRLPGPLSELWLRHTPFHHGSFHEELMEVRCRREWRFVLLPPIGIAGLVLLMLPIALLLGWALAPRFGALWLAVGASYVASYEWLHLAYHLPLSHPVGGSRLIAVLRRHHALHHRPEMMQRYNFNVTVPLWDWVRGTWADGDQPP